MRKDVVYQIANRCREISEQFVCSPEAQGFDFFDYSGRKDLACFCACASVFLAQKLNEHGIKAVAIRGSFDSDEGDNHCWVDVDNNIIDITATQFGIRDKIFITTYNNSSFYVSMGHIKSIYCLHGWPVEQKPNKKVIDKLNELYKENLCK